MPGCARKQCQGCQRGAGYLQQNLGGRRQGAAHSQKHPSGAHVERSGEFQQFLTFVVAAADKNRYGQRQARPFSPFA